MTSSATLPDAATLAGTLHIFVAFDWGDEIHLDQARQLASAAKHELPRRRRTPLSFSYRPAPVRVAAAPVRLQLDELGVVEVAGGVTLFDFGAISIAFRIPFALRSDALLRLAGSLADPAPIVQQARAATRPLFEQLKTAIKDAAWDEEFSEEYFVFQFAPGAMYLSTHPDWLAGMVHLEAGPLSAEEAEEAVRLRISYSPNDLCVMDWPAAVLIDQDCEETLQAIEFANLQLLEFRHIDHRLDQKLGAAQHMLAPFARSYLPFWRMFDRSLRVLGELKVEANDLFERTGNVLKLVGEPYLARVYRLVAQRFHLEAWEKNIQRKLDVAEGVYKVVSDQTASYRAEFLELMIVLLIIFEIVMAFVRY